MQTGSITGTLTETKYPLMEHFYTLQGEGFWTGTPAYFLRLGGCDVGCHWCDVKASWDEEAHPAITVGEMIQNIRNSGAIRVVVTGGEPFMHDLGPLTTALMQEGFKTHCETSGAHPFTGTWDWICLSPKKFKPALPEFYGNADELKIVIANNHDLKWALEESEKCSKNTRLFVQPEWSRQDLVPSIIDFVRQNPKWRLSIQTHKYLNIP